MKKFLSFTVFWLLLFFTAAIAAEYTFVDVKVPGVRHTSAFGINDLGDVVGSFTQDESTPPQGFLYSDGEFFNVEIPGGSSVVPFGINRAGVIVGIFDDGSFLGASFVQDDENTTIIEAPSAEGINGKGTVVGWRPVGSINQLAYSWKRGVFTDIVTEVEFPGLVGSVATGINDKDHIVGYYFVDAGECCHEIHGFIKRGKKIVTFDSPFGVTLPAGINNKGEIVGSAGGVNFVYSRGEFTEINVPEAACCTSVFGINNKGQIVGTYVKNGEATGFVGTKKKTAGRK